MGPPPVTMNAWVNTMKPVIVCITRLKKVTGESSGRVIRKKRDHEPAPSMAAAS